jgi:hypothetical protein
VLIKEKNILLKKIYLPPSIIFEEIEEDELEMLLVSKGYVDEGDTGGEGTNTPGELSLDISFEEATTGQSSTSLSDFIINDEY